MDEIKNYYSNEFIFIQNKTIYLKYIKNYFNKNKYSLKMNTAKMFRTINKTRS